MKIKNKLLPLAVACLLFACGTGTSSSSEPSKKSLETNTQDVVTDSVTDVTTGDSVTTSEEDETTTDSLTTSEVGEVTTGDSVTTSEDDPVSSSEPTTSEEKEEIRIEEDYIATYKGTLTKGKFNSFEELEVVITEFSVTINNSIVELVAFDFNDGIEFKFNEKVYTIEALDNEIPANKIKLESKDKEVEGVLTRVGFEEEEIEPFPVEAYGTYVGEFGGESITVVIDEEGASIDGMLTTLTYNDGYEFHLESFGMEFAIIHEEAEEEWTSIIFADIDFEEESVLTKGVAFEASLQGTYVGELEEEFLGSTTLTIVVSANEITVNGHVAVVSNYEIETQNFIIHVGEYEIELSDINTDGWSVMNVFSMSPWIDVDLVRQ